MKIATTDMINHLKDETLQLATLWRVTRSDGMVMCFTDFNKDIVDGADTYQSSSGYNRTAVKTTADLATNNMDLESVFQSGAITEIELRAGLYDFARVDIYVINWAHPSYGKVSIFSGFTGEATVQDQTYKVELRGLTDKLKQNIGEVTTPLCRANFGDARCKAVPHQFTGTIGAVVSQWEFHITVDPSVAHGVCMFTSGPNSGKQIEIKSYDGAIMILLVPAPFAVTAGDTVTCNQGCDKQFDTCRATFLNFINFRGEPKIPGNDTLWRIPDYQTDAGSKTVIDGASTSTSSTNTVVTQ